MKQIVGQIGLFDAKPVNEKNECLGEPCMHCDVEWCSAKCFIRRGYRGQDLMKPTMTKSEVGRKYGGIRH